MQGKTINGFTIKSLLGVGGMAEVWQAENALGKKVAVKLLLHKFCNDEHIVARFQNEAKVMVQLDHPNIRQVYDYSTIDGQPCIVMEYLEGDDLKALMKSGRHFTDPELRKWWDQIADALNYTHSRGVVHRDIKPSNLFLDKKGNVKLLDFGIAKIRESISMTQTGAMMGTLMYMSPEQVEDAKYLGPESDIYSLAVTFVHLLSGKAPYDTSTTNDFKIRESIVYKPLDMTGVSVEWQGFLAPYLAKRPEDRPVLRLIETVPFEAPIQQTESYDEGTIVNDVKSKPQPTPNRNHGLDSHSLVSCNTPAPKSKRKKRFWIGFAVALIAALVAVLFSHLNQRGNYNGHQFVDLGLPSGTLWATCNVGANNPEDYGYYFAWGETQTKSTYEWATYQFANGDYNKLTQYCNMPSYGKNQFTDHLTILRATDDVAATNWGEGWRMPTKEQWEELLQNTIVKSMTRNSVKGRLFISKKNGRTLFLPATGFFSGCEHCDANTGYYWSQSLNADYPYSAWYLYFNLSDHCYMSGYYRHCGLGVRPVREN